MSVCVGEGAVRLKKEPLKKSILQFGYTELNYLLNNQVERSF